MDQRPDAATWLARALSAALVLLALARALTLGGEYYDSYESRLAARTLLGWDTGAPFPVYRSPLLVLASVACEPLGRRIAWLGPALLSVAAYAGLVAAVEGLARRLGAAPWAAAAAGLLCALDLAAWGYAPHGLSDLPAACACALVLLVAARPGAWAARPVLLGALVGLAALTRHSTGLVGLALVAGALLVPPAERPRALGRVALAGAAAVGVYLAVTTLLFAWAAGSLDGGLAGHRELAAFQRVQLQENALRHGAAQHPLSAALFLVAGSPWLLVLGPVGAGLALRRGAPVAARACVAWALVHLLALTLLAGHVEARYVLPALPALCAVAALALSRLPSRVPLVAALVAGHLLLVGSFAVRHALDPAVSLRSFPEHVARVVASVRGPEGRVFWTTTHPYPVAPLAITRPPGTPFAGDPFHGIYHLGPVVLAYHLKRPVELLPPPPGRPGGLHTPAELSALVRHARLPDQTTEYFRDGDVLVAGTPYPGRTQDVVGRRWPPLLVARVRRGPDGALEVEPHELATHR